MTSSRAWGLTRAPRARNMDSVECLTTLCRAGLRKTLNPLTALYDRQIRDARLETTFGTEDLTSTCICLIGVDRSGLDPSTLSLSPQLTLDAVIELARRRRYAGGLGLLVWANAVLDGLSLDELLNRVGLSLDEPGTFVSQLTTMETAWLASGLLHEFARSGNEPTQRLAQATLAALSDRYNESSQLMRHASAEAPLSHRMRLGIANFADQIYSVQAFAFAAMVLGDKQALERAAGLATQLVTLQGPLGQWWWHYDAAVGEVAEPYPVYSVHQHAMAPMALLALRAAGGPDFAGAVARSYGWLRRNELSIDMVDRKAETIWRDIERAEGGATSALHKSLELIGRRRPAIATRKESLKLNRETRPYEWAWCLYANSIAEGTEKGRHLL
ncbi:MAG: hypothetical protein JWM36_843 [Hyphomicrobiales bacterium]|nr:hypothetical protein [Hyphomicrobiales bacterium]